MKMVKVLTLLLITVLFPILLIGCDEGHINKQGVVITTLGSVTVTRMDKKPIQLKVGDIVKPGDTIETRINSFVTIQAGNHLYCNIRPLSKVIIARLNLHGSSELHLPEGKIMLNVKKLQKNTDFRVKTPTVVASVRGTSFSVCSVPGIDTVAVKVGSVLVEPALIEGDEKRGRSVFNGKIVQEGTTFVASAQKNIFYKRSIGKIESLELEKVDSAIYARDLDFVNGKDIINAGKENSLEEEEIDKEIKKALKEMPLKALIDIKRVYGRLDVIEYYTGNKFSGLILKRGEVYKILLPGRVAYISAKKIKGTTWIR